MGSGGASDVAARSASRGEAGHRRRHLEAVAAARGRGRCARGSTSRRSTAGPSPDAATGSAARRDELALQRGDGDLLVVVGRARARRRRARRRRRRASGRAGPTCGRRTRGAPLTRQYAGGRGLHDEQLGRRAVDEAGPDVDERAEHLGHPAAVVVRVDERLGVGAGQAGPDDPGAEHDQRAGDGDGRAARSTAGCGRGRARCAGPGRSGPAAGRRRGTPAATRASVSATRWRSAPRAATNTNSTAPGTSASPLAWARKANVSRREHDERRADQRPAATSRRRTRRAPRPAGTGRAPAPRSAHIVFHVSDVGKNAANVDG